MTSDEQGSKDTTGGESPRDAAAPQPGGQPGDRPEAKRRPGGEPEDHTPAHSFGDAAGEMANETEVEGSDDQARSDELTLAQTALAERTLDLQRLQAEFLNYKRRVDRDRELVKQNATFGVLSGLLPVLDDIDRAREHGDLVGPFASVAESLTAVTGKLGLTAFGEKGDPFDPNRHKAVAHQTSADVTEPTCVEVMRRGYTLGERLLRAALVAVADPE